MPTIEIRVEAEDIAEGKPNRICYCPIALAMKRSGFRGPSVGRIAVSWVDSLGSVIWSNLPNSAKEFVDQFDRYGRNGLVQPFAFKLRYRKPKGG